MRCTRFPGRHPAWARREIERLDPVADNERISHLTTDVRYGDPLLVTAAYSITFARQAAVPTIARVLDRGGGGESLTSPRKRHDDTILIFAEIYRRGHSTELGERAIAHLNAIHARFSISNEDYLYTLATVIFEPERLARQVGATALTPKEQQARFVFWRHVAGKMGIVGVPEDRHEFERWSLAYERERYAFTPGGRRLVESVADSFALRWLPPPLRRAGRAALFSLFDEHLRATHGLAARPFPVATAARAAVRAYLWTRRNLWDPPERDLADAFAGPYGPDFEIERVGPPALTPSGGLSGAA